VVTRQPLAGFLNAVAPQMGNFAEIPQAQRQDTPPPRSQELSQDAHAIRRILVCVDRSPFSEGCLMHAIAVAAGLGSAITLLHVMEAPHERYGSHTADLVDWEISRQEADARLEQLLREGEQAGARSIGVRLEQGHAAERIAAVARELDADLTVLAGHGERGLSAWSLGSTVQQVLSMTHRSVLIARSPRGPARDASPKRILVPLDGSLRTESVLPTAARIARAHGADLLLVFVAADPVATAVMTGDVLALARELALRLEKHGRDYLERVREQLARDGASVRTMFLRSSDERRALVDLSEKDGSDLIVLSAHGSTCDPASTFGSVTTYVLLHSVVSVLVLQDMPDTSKPEREEPRSAPPPRASFAELI
jgi:nucleotide-binding universal stress UspA family protein